MFLVAEEGWRRSCQGVKKVIESRGLFSSFYSDRGSHDWHAPEARSQADKKTLTRFGVAQQRLGIEMIPAYSPEARGRSERMFRTHQDRLPRELALATGCAFGAENKRPATHRNSLINAWRRPPA